MPMQPSSPRMGAMTAADSASDDQAKQYFERGLTDMAYNVLGSRFPDVAPDVVTFKILDSDAEAGHGVGAFVLVRQGQVLYVPVVMVDNQLKPLDLFFHKDGRVFLPLNKEWLDEVGRSGARSLGQGVKTPEMISSDVDVRNLVVPPTTGRYSYAAYVDMSVATVDSMIKAARTPEEPSINLVTVLEGAPNAFKIATARVLERNPRLLKLAAHFHTADRLLSALTLRREKSAAEKAKEAKEEGPGEVHVVDRESDGREFKRVFGEHAGDAYSVALTNGYAVKDERPASKRKRMLRVEGFQDLQEPKTPGVYRLWRTDGKPIHALVISNPQLLSKDDRYNDHLGSRTKPPRNVRFIKQNDKPANPNQGHGHVYRTPGVDGTDQRDCGVSLFTGITEDGEVFLVDRMLGDEVSASHMTESSAFKKLVAASAEGGPRAGQRGIFVRSQGGSFNATVPVEVLRVQHHSDGRRVIDCVTLSGMPVHKQLVTDERSPYSRITVPADSDVAYLPADYKFLPGKTMVRDSHHFLSNPKDVLQWAGGTMLSAGAVPIEVRRAADGGFLVGDRTKGSRKKSAALRHLMVVDGLGHADAEELLKSAADAGVAQAWALDARALSAAHAKLAAAQPQQPQQPQQDPAQAMMDQVQQAPQAPAGPSPVDMAVAEAMQQAQSQVAALQQQMQVIQQIQQRSNEIAGGGGAMAAPAAAAAAIAPPMQAPPGMPPQAMDPSMQQSGAPQPGMDPNAQPQEPPPSAMMTGDTSTDPNVLAQQVNPQYAEQAGQLGDAGVFDASLLASMAQAPTLKELVASYVPNLEKALDNVGRVLLVLWLDEARLRNEVGIETYVEIEDNLRSVFRGLGELILRVNQNSQVIPGRYEQQA